LPPAAAVGPKEFGDEKSICVRTLLLEGYATFEKANAFQDLVG